MTIEKAFAISAPPDAIYDALVSDLSSASQHEGDVFSVVRQDRPRRLDLRVTIGGVPCTLTYAINARDADCEVVATLEPRGFKYALFKIITLGMHDQGFEVVLVEGLRNLKATVEGRGDGAYEKAAEEPPS